MWHFVDIDLHFLIFFANIWKIYIQMCFELLIQFLLWKSWLEWKICHTVYPFCPFCKLYDWQGCCYDVIPTQVNNSQWFNSFSKIMVNFCLIVFSGSSYHNTNVPGYLTHKTDTSNKSRVGLQKNLLFFGKYVIYFFCWCFNGILIQISTLPISANKLLRN